MALNKTITPADVQAERVAPTARELRAFMRAQFWRGQRVAVNGVSKRRLNIRWNKLWEYSRGLGLVPWQPGWTAVDFGGGATLPVYYLASRGLTVHSYDIDTALTAEAQQAAQRHGWPVHATTQDLTRDAAGIPTGVDWVMSFCVLEHLPREAQLHVASLLGGMLRPGGWFTVTFDYSPEAPVEGALRSPEDVRALIEASGCVPEDGVAFEDTGERFVLDRKYPDARFTFGSLFLRKPGAA
jgi:hypothetical protein